MLRLLASRAVAGTLRGAPRSYSAATTPAAVAEQGRALFSGTLLDAATVRPATERPAHERPVTFPVDTYELVI